MLSDYLPAPLLQSSVTVHSFDACGGAARRRAGSAGRAWRGGVNFDCILLDAPCTATGTARRHPDVLHLKSPADRDKLAALQTRLLDRAAALVAPGGTLVYCTCSLEPEEGVRQVERFLGANTAFRRQPVRLGEVGGLAEILTDEGDIRSLPCHMGIEGGMDGFFAARLERG